MIDPSRYLDELARRAREEHSPHGQAAPAVLLRLESAAEPEITRPLFAFTMGSVLLCAAALALFQMLSADSVDPLVQFFQNQASLASLGWS